MAQTHQPTDSMFSTKIWQALKQWHGSSTTSQLEHLSLYRQAQRAQLGTPRQITNQILLQALERLGGINSQQAQLLRLHYLDCKKIGQLANQLNVVESTLYAKQSEAIASLATIVLDMEQEVCATQQAALDQRLGVATYTHLIGVEPQLQILSGLLTQPGPPWIVALEGLGGLGKTSLADALLRQVANLNIFDDFGWVSARQTIFSLAGELQPVKQPALTAAALIERLLLQLAPDLPNSATLNSPKMLTLLRARLKTSPHLIVIDNLETLVDLAELLPTLQQLVNPSKVLLTSRASLYSELYIHHFSIPELCEADALALVRQEARFSNLAELANSADAVLHPIYATVGGNPLALRLVVGQTHVLGLDTILQNLAAARGQSGEALYHHIYHQAWQHLDPLSQQVLLAMPLVNEQGEGIEYLATLCDLGLGELQTALTKLMTLNLINSQGSLHVRRYSVHNLTRNFIEQVAAKWH